MSVASHTTLNNSGAAKTVVTPHLGMMIEIEEGGTSLMGDENDNSIHPGHSADGHKKMRRFPAKNPTATNVNDVDAEEGSDDESSSDTSSERSVNRMTEMSRKIKKKSAKQKKQVEAMQKRKNALAGASVIRDNTGRTGMLKKFPSLKNNDDDTSNETFLELSKVVEKYQAHLPIASGKKEVTSRLIPHCKPTSLARSYASALKDRFDRLTTPGYHSSSANHLDFENFTDADVKALTMHKEKDDFLTERKGCIEEKNEHKRAVAEFSDFVAPPPPPATSYSPVAAGGIICIDSDSVSPVRKVNQKKGGGKKGKASPPGASGGMKDAIEILGTQHNQQNQNNFSKIVDIMLENKRIKEVTTNTTSVIAAQCKDKYQTLSQLKIAFDNGCFTEAEYASEKEMVMALFATNKEREQ
eukprot:scaffold2807_cov32-Attheya_sp.AAC.1